MSDSIEENKPSSHTVESNTEAINMSGSGLADEGIAILSPVSPESAPDPSYLWTVEAAYDFAKAIQTPGEPL